MRPCERLGSPSGWGTVPAELLGAADPGSLSEGESRGLSRRLRQRLLYFKNQRTVSL